MGVRRPAPREAALRLPLSNRGRRDRMRSRRAEGHAASRWPVQNDTGTGTGGGVRKPWQVPAWIGATILLLYFTSRVDRTALRDAAAVVNWMWIVGALVANGL